MKWQSLVCIAVIGGWFAVTTPTTPTARADDPPESRPAAAEEVAAAGGGEGADAEAAAGRAAVEEALRPLTEVIARSTDARALVELTTRSMIAGRVIASETTRFQIASKAPNFYRIHLKGDQQNVQVVSDGTQASVLLDGGAYYQSPAPERLQQVVTSLPVPLGPYPEPLMALTLAGVDPAAALLSDMQSLAVANRDPYEGTAAVQLRGTQADGVSWVLWLASEKANPRPLRLKVDLTAVVVGDNAAGLPEGFAYEIDYKFTLWRTGGALDKSIFTFAPPADAQRFESLEDYAQSLEAETLEHPLVGKPAPDFSTKRLDGTAWKLSEQRGKVVVLDFWATWCAPCVEAMPLIGEVAGAFDPDEVMLYTVNIGQSPEQIKEFLQRLQIEVPVLLDAEGSIADAYAAEAIPQTVLIGKDGRIEAVHVGFAGLDALKQQLSEQLQVLVAGGTLLVADDQP